MSKVRVWKFSVFSMGGKEESGFAGRYATMAAIAILGGRVIADSYIYVDEEELESGMTKIGCAPKLD